MPNVQVAVGFGWKAGANFGRVRLACRLVRAIARYCKGDCACQEDEDKHGQQVVDTQRFWLVVGQQRVHALLQRRSVGNRENSFRQQRSTRMPTHALNGEQRRCNRPPRRCLQRLQQQRLARWLSLATTPK